MKIQSRVLLMDDEVQFRRPFGRALKRHGLEVRIATSLNHLVNLAKSQRFDAALLDIRMSQNGIEGLTAIIELREMYPEMYIEVITAFGEYATPARDRGADAVFIKPDTGKNPAQRIREGILKKRLETLAEVSNIGVDELDIHHIENIEEKSFQAAIVSNCIDVADRFLAEAEEDLGIEEEKILQFRQDLAETLANTTASPLTRKPLPFVEVAKDLSADENYLAFDKEKSELTAQKGGQYVAYTQGKRIAVRESRHELLSYLDQVCPDTSCFVTKIETKQRTVTFRRPQRFEKP